jgi:hypothetical protein
MGGVFGNAAPCGGAALDSSSAVSSAELAALNVAANSYLKTLASLANQLHADETNCDD